MKRKPAIDTRPKWFDPDLPVFGKSGKAIDPSKMVLKAQLTLARSPEPGWKDDPTYNLRRKR